MRFIRHSLMGLFLLAVTLGLLAYAVSTTVSSVQDRMAREARPPQGRERVFSVEVQRAEPRTETPVLTAFGEVQSRRSLDLRASAAGPIVMLADGFEEGGRVEAGELLARIDPANAQSALDRSESDLEDAGAEERDAQRALVLARDELTAAQDQAALRDRAFQRQRDLENRGVGTAATVEAAELAAASARQSVLARRQALAQAEARIDKATTRLARARIGVAEARRRLDDTEIRAEFAGTLSEVSAVQGGLVSQNERLARIVDPDMLEVAFQVSTAQYARLLNDAGRLMPVPVTVSMDTLGVDLAAHGTISRDSAAVGAGRTGRLVFAGLEDPRGLKPGDFVTVRASEPAVERVVRLPATAVDAAKQVLVLGEENRLETLEVQIVRRQGNDVLVRGQGLAGREVVTRRTPLLGAGIRVKPLRPPEAGAAQPEEPEFVELSAERKAKLVAFVEGNQRMPADVKERILGALARDSVPARLVARIESRMGG